MLKRLYIAAFCALTLVSVYGCAGPKAANAPLEAPGDLAYEQLNTTQRFRIYKNVGIRPFSTEGAAYLSTDPTERREMDAFVKTAAEHVIQGFLSEMKDNYYEHVGVVDTEEDAKNYDLIIDGQFTEFDRGNAAARFWGVGGEARVTVRGTMTETATGKVVVNFNDTKRDVRNLGTEYLMGDCCEEIGGNLSDFMSEVY